MESIDSCLAKTEAISFIMTKVEMAKKFHLQIWKKNAILWGKSNRNQFTDMLQVFNAILIKLPPLIAKKITKMFYIKKSSFAILTFVIIEEMASV